MREATNTANILGLGYFIIIYYTFAIYSQIRKTVTPNLLATDTTYLALLSISSYVSPTKFE